MVDEPIIYIQPVDFFSKNEDFVFYFTFNAVYTEIYGIIYKWKNNIFACISEDYFIFKTS